jgi:hypothetical protein
MTLESIMKAIEVLQKKAGRLDENAKDVLDVLEEDENDENVQK